MCPTFSRPPNPISIYILPPKIQILAWSYTTPKAGSIQKTTSQVLTIYTTITFVTTFGGWRPPVFCLICTDIYNTVRPISNESLLKNSENDPPHSSSIISQNSSYIYNNSPSNILKHFRSSNSQIWSWVGTSQLVPQNQTNMPKSVIYFQYNSKLPPFSLK